MSVIANSVFVTVWGDVKVDDFPPEMRAAISSAVLRKNGNLDMRYTHNKKLITMATELALAEWEKKQDANLQHS